MGKGGGGGAPAPTQSTAYNTNIPEYAKPYVMNMLGAAQNQLFTTTPGTNGEPGEITGFKPYTPYSTDPTKYFAGPTGLQQNVYGEAARMQTPGQFGQASGLAGTAGMGQLGTAQQAGIYGGLGTALGAAGAMQAMPAFSAGQQFASQVTDPRAYAAYMSPYQQAVTDVAKNAAVREAQIAGNQANLGAARQGTYGGARQALMQGERERNLLANLSNIQAQGSQSAFDKAMQTQQFGANLGLQGIQTGLQGVQAGMQGIGQGLQGVGAQQAGYAGAGQAASTLGQLGTAGQQADLARMGFQQQTGQQQQAYQQNIINQAIQDFATAQQYPYMQLSTMSNLLRGLPMQSMSTQQYQAQPSTTQQLLGLAGTGASLYGAMGRKEGGAIKEYAAGGEIKGLGYANRGVVDSMRDRLETMAETNPQGLKKLIAQSSSKEVKDMGKEILSGIALGDAGELGRNMAGGGIIAFNGEDGSYVDPLMQFSGLTDEGLTEDELRRKKMFEDFKSTDYQKAQRMLAQEREAIGRGVRVLNPLDPSTAKAAAAGPATKEGIEAGPPVSAMFGRDTTSGAPAAGVNQSAPGSQATGLAEQLALRDKFLGERGAGGAMGEEARGLMDYIKAGKERRQSEAASDRYLRMADAFAQFGSTAGPFMASASKALGGFAKGEAGAQKELRAADFADKKMAADIEKGQRAEARGDFEAAQKAYDSAENRKVQREGHLSSAQASMYSADRETRMIEKAMADPEFLKTMQTMKGNDNVTVQAIKAQLADIGQQMMFAGKDEALKKKLMEQRAALNARLGEIAKVNDAAPASAQEIKVISNEAEYAKLKKGQQYRDPNGEIRTKG
jgi:hypothetical protein